MCPSLFDYRTATLQEEGGVLGVMMASVTLDPDPQDRDAARSLISARLYDDEKLSGAHGGQYVWIPKWSDQRRTIQRGYRVRYATVYAPPPDGTFALTFYGYGSTHDLPSSSSASTVQAEVRKISLDLVDIEVEDDPLGFLFHLPFRVGIGATTGRMVAAGGVGINLVNRDFSQPLRKGTLALISPRMPFETEDELLGLHDCINLALADIREPDLLPVVTGVPASQRSSVIRLVEIAPWLEASMVTGFYAPTNWTSVTTFRPPSNGTYLLRPVSAVEWPSIATPLPYSATGAEIENALQAVIGQTWLRVEPSGPAVEYTITWQSMHHQTTVVASAGAITDYRSQRQRDPYPTTIAPAFTGDFEADTFSDPGYGVDQSWFVACRRPASTRICPQTYPRRADGNFDLSCDPIPGTLWVESVRGLQHDFDQARPPVEVVAPAAMRYACLALAAVAPAGESARWEAMAARSAMVAASRVVYGKQERRHWTTVRGWPPLGEKALPFFLPG